MRDTTNVIRRDIHRKTGVRHPVVVALMLILAGCGTTGETPGPSLPAGPSLAPRDSAISAPPGEASSPDLPSEARMSLDPPVAAEKVPSPDAAPSASAAPPLPSILISLDLVDTPLREVLTAVAQAGHQNIIVSEHVSGAATLHVASQPWSDVFLGLMKTHGLTWEREGHILRVLATEDIQRDFQRVDLLARKNQKEEQLRRGVDLETRVIRIRYADTEALLKIFEKYLAENQAGEDRDKGFVMRDPYNNALIIRANPQDLATMTSLAADLDQPTHQVRIEAHIVEASDGTARELGIQWSGLYQTGASDARWIVAPGLPSSGSGGGTTQTSSSDAGFSPGTLLGANGISLGVFYKNSVENLLGAQLKALEKQGEINILSTPSITTLDHQTALIESGEEVPFQTVEDNETNIEFKKAVLKLEVTPHVIDGDKIKMKVLTFKDELNFSNSVDGNPSVLTKNASTTVLLRDGESTVIGGLRKHSSTNASQGVPFLMNLPLIGHLFRQQSRENTKEEILIFITPHILPPPAAATPRRGEP